MAIEALRNIWRFIILLALQVLILNNVQFSIFVNPYLYVLFIALLPIRMPKSLVMIIAFVTGLVAGLFTNTVGIHAAACTFAAFCRPGILRLLSPREGYESEMKPVIQDLGIGWFVAYISLLLLAHHFVLFYLEVFRFSEFFQTLLRVILSALFSLVIIIISQYLFGKTKVER
jgi:rod shape-determining protein MreD